MTDQKHPRSLSESILTSDLLKVFGLDFLLLAAVALIGVSVFRLSPALLPGYAGVILLVIWWAIGSARAKSGPRANG